MTLSSATKSALDELEHELDDIVHDALGEVFCHDCEHPRCLNKVKLYKKAIQSIIRTEKLKLLAEVRERVVEQAKPDERKATSWQQGIEVSAYEDAVRVYEYKMNEQLTKLEAEL